MEGRSGCFLNRPGKHDRVLVISPSGITVTISSFASTTSPSAASIRGVQRIKLSSGRAGRVFRAPFAGWSAVIYHDVRGKRLTVSQNTFSTGNINGQRISNEQIMSAYAMDNSTALEIQDDESVLDVRWQHITKYSRRDDDYLGAILTDKRIYIVRQVLQLLSSFD